MKPADKQFMLDVLCSLGARMPAGDRWPKALRRNFIHILKMLDPKIRRVIIGKDYVRRLYEE